MATSGTTTYTVTRDTIINAALRLLGVIGTTETASTQDVTNCAEALNIMIKAWMVDGAELWTVVDSAVTLAAGVVSYVLGPGGTQLITNRILRVLQSYLHQTASGLDTPLTILSRAEYINQSNKATTGVVNSVYYNPGTTSGTLYVYPAPSDATYTLHIICQIPIQDMVNSTDNFDFPQEWFQALKWGLADEIAMEYGVAMSTVELIAQKAAIYKGQVLNTSVEEASVYIQPDQTMAYRRPW